MCRGPHIFAALALALAACHGPTLWIGELDPDAATPRQRPTLPPEENDASEKPVDRDAGEAKPADRDASAQPPPQITTGPMDGPTTPPSMRDASVTLPIDDADAGVTSPWDTGLPKPTRLPTVRGRCPDLSSGSGTFTFGDPRTRTLSVDIYIAPDARTKQGPPGPVILYFHALGANSREVVTGLGQVAIDAVMMVGGVVASFTAKLCANCGPTDDVVWYLEDDAVIDQVVACAIEQAHIDTRRIHAVGFSAGAMHTLHLALARSDYIASVVSYSGGRANIAAEAPQDPSNRVPVLLAYGRVGLDFGAVDFPMLSLQWYETFKAMGWYTMMCDHQGGHVIPPDLVPKVLLFLYEHSYKFEPEMYAAGVPSHYPSYCANEPRAR